MRKRIRDLRPGDRISGIVAICDHCRVWFIARRHTVYCSNSCKVLAHRKRRPVR